MANANEVNDRDNDERNEDPSDPMSPQDLLEEIILAIVDDPSEMKVVEISDTSAPNKIILEVRVGASDRGKVIGKGGVIAQSLRTLFGLIGQKTKTNIEVRIDAGPDHKSKPRTQNRPNYRFPQEEMVMVPVSTFYGSQGRYTNQRRSRGGNGGF